ncbi:MAG: phosphonate C-P lyase system protein PhnH [Eggerthellaceae bacterium]|jgi:alpha-D-ribose 1-methylphosphonate 5-triphosphate synthase subunit PhnH|nr:phosphonate C-P lyase system protein PhnH [Eggerthellaceae bacterium]MDR2715493.1 phosphonate C-P lyase system protein PhnH [Coriobacteriaceae bacterium]
MGADKELHHIQLSFRAVMDAMARPGRVYGLPATQGKKASRFGLEGPLETLVKMFIDQAVSFCVVAPDPAGIQDAIVAETHARTAGQADAAFVVVPHGCDKELAGQAIVQASAGSFLSPEAGATVLLGCERLAFLTEREGAEAGDASLYWVSVEGPGVRDSHVFGIDCFDWVWARKRRGDEFPCGIEIILVDRQGQVAAIPRSSFLSVLAMEGGAEGEEASWLM